MNRGKFHRTTYGSIWYCGGRSLQANIIIYTFYHPAKESWVRKQFEGLVGPLISECGEKINSRAYEREEVNSTESRGLGFYRLALVLDNAESERFDLRFKGSVDSE